MGQGSGRAYFLFLAISPGFLFGYGSFFGSGEWPIVPPLWNWKRRLSKIRFVASRVQPRVEEVFVDRCRFGRVFPVRAARSSIGGRLGNGVSLLLTLFWLWFSFGRRQAKGLRSQILDMAHLG